MDTTTGQAWIGFNASHSLGMTLFGGMYGYLPPHEPIAFAIRIHAVGKLDHADGLRIIWAGAIGPANRSAGFCCSRSSTVYLRRECQTRQSPPFPRG